jgi:hypothetical protein
MTEKLSPFAWVDALCNKKSDPMAEHGEAAYPAFMVNRAMSQYQDCVFYANEMNLYRELDARLAYDFYMHGIRAKKRYAKWGKKVVPDDNLKAVMSHYGVNRDVAEAYSRLMTSDQLDQIVEFEAAKSGQ